MSPLSPSTPPPDDAGRSLPDALRDALADVPAEERDALVTAWHHAGSSAPGEPPDDAFAALGAELWNAIDAATATDAPATRRPAADRATVARSTRRGWLHAVAVGLPLAAMLVAAWFVLSRPERHAAPYGERLTVELADGTVVELNSGATLDVAHAFGDAARTVSLRGEAYFDVAPDAARPFVVETYNAAVTVLGTRFNVRAWPGEPGAATEVALAEGRVRLAPSDAPARHVVLAPGQLARVVAPDRAPALPGTADLGGALAWRDGAFVFPGTKPLGAVLDELERRFDVRVEAAEDVRGDVLALRLDRPADAETVLRDLCAAYDAYAYRAVDGGFELYRRADAPAAR